jgi:hypothetical protein
MSIHPFAVTIGVAIMMLMAAPSARAYPYFQTTSGNDTCGACHVSPTGGGPLSVWGRVEAGDTLALGGNGEFLHGRVQLPDWLDLGGDVRLASLINDTGNPNGAEAAAFPMQLELNVHATQGEWSAVANAGALGAVRSAPSSSTGVVEPQVSLPWLMSRDHYILWQSDVSRRYVRIGRFYPPYGLRLADHTAYVRRQLGFGLYEEPYVVSAGYVGTTWDLHVAAFASDRWRWAPRREAGGVAMVEHRKGRLVTTINTRVASGDTQSRALLGMTAKVWHERTSLLWLAEWNVGWQWLPGLQRLQLAGYEGFVWFPTRGFALGAAYEHYNEDIGQTDAARHAADAWLTFMPRAHVELGLSTRYQWIGSDGHAATALLQVHYFL